MRCFLGIDLGLSGARAAILSPQGKLLGTGRSQTPGIEGTGEQDPTQWLAAVSQAVGAGLAAAGNPPIEAIGIGALGPCAVTLDENLAPLGKVSLFSLDARAEPLRQELISRGIAESSITTDHVVPRLMWLRDSELDRFARTAWVLDATGFLVASLTGLPVMDPITTCDHMIEGLKPLRPMPVIRKADEIAGKVTADAARRFGLSEGTPVSVGSYDSYVDLFGAGVRNIGDAGMLLGTTLVIGKVVDGGSCGPDLRITPHIGEGSFLGGWTSTSGSLIDWSASLLGPEAVACARRSKPGRAGILILPYFAGERTPVWDALAQGAIIGPTLKTTGGDLHRAAIDAVALTAMDIARRIEEASGPLETFRVSGGGARNLPLIEAIANATGATLEIAAHPGEAVAPAILAAHAAGIEIETAIDSEIRPDRACSEVYDRLLEIYRPLYGKLKDTMHAMGALAEAREGQ